MSRARTVAFALCVVLIGLCLRIVPHLPHLPHAPHAAEFVAATGNPAMHSATAPTAALDAPTFSGRSMSSHAARVLAEAILVVVALLIVLLSPAFSRPLARTRPGLRRFALVLLGLFSAGLLGGQPRVTFPLMPWRMYSGVPIKPPFVCRIVATTAGGHAVELDLDTVLPVTAPRRLGHLLRRQILALQTTTDPAEYASLWEVHVHTLQALARLHMRHHEGSAAVQHIAVYGGRVSGQAVHSFPDSLPRLWQVPL